VVEEKQSTKVEEPENSKYKSLGYLQELNPDKAKAIMKYHEEINSQIDQTGNKIKKIVAEHESDFLAAFEQKMYIV